MVSKRRTHPIEVSSRASNIGSAEHKEWTDTRYRIFARFGWRCCKCGTTKSPTVDHIIPKSAGGTDHDHNLQLLCETHNKEKGSQTIDYR